MPGDDTARESMESDDGEDSLGTSASSAADAGDADACQIPGAKKSSSDPMMSPTEEPLESGAAAEASGAGPEKQLPVYTCFLCGQLPPGEQVWQCTLCLQNFCVKHLEPRLHYCYAGQST